MITEQVHSSKHQEYPIPCPPLSFYPCPVVVKNIEISSLEFSTKKFLRSFITELSSRANSFVLSVPQIRSHKLCSGEYSTAVSGEYSTAVSGEYSTAVSGKDNTAVSGEYSTAVSGEYSTAVSGEYSTAVSGEYNTAVSGEYSTAVSGEYNTAVSGEYNTAQQ